MRLVTFLAGKKIGAVYGDSYEREGKWLTRGS